MATDLGKAYVQIIPSAEGISGKIEQALNGGGEAEKAGSNIGGKIASAAGAAIAAGTAAITAFGVESVKVGSEFDAAMSQVAATMGLTVDDIGTLRDFAQEMGATTSFSATQSAEALNYMALAGYDASEAMEMLPTVLDLAAAGGVGLASASDMVTDAQSALGLSMEETSELVDKMAQASSKSNTSVAQLGDAILTVGGTAKNLSGGTTELATALGILADNGIKGSEGGTALRNILNSLADPTEAAEIMMHDLGVSVFDAEGNMRSLNDIFLDLGKAMESMTQEERMNVVSTMFNARDMKSAEALLANVGDRWNELAGYIDNASGSAEKMANTQLDNLQGDITLLQSAFEGVQIAVSDQLTGSLREFVQFGSDAMSRLGEAITTGGLSAGIAELGTILGEGITMIAGYLPDIVEAGSQLVEGFLMAVLDAAPSLAQAAVEMVAALASGLGESLPELIPAIVEAVTMIAETLLAPDNLNMLLDAGLQLILGLAEGLLNAVPQLIEALPGIIEGIVTFLSGAVPQIVDAGITLLMGIVEAIPEIVSALIDALPQIIQSIVDFYKNDYPTMLEAGIELLYALIDAIPDIITALVDALPEIIKTIVDVLIEAVPQLVETGFTLFVSLIKELPKILSELGAAAKQILESLGQAFLDGVEYFAEIGKNLVEGLWNGLQNAWTWLKEKVSSLVSSLVDGVKNMLGISSPSKVFAEIGGFMAEGMGVGFDKEFPSVQRDIEKSLDFSGRRLTASVYASAASGYNAGGGDTYNVTIDAASVREFSDIVKLAQNQRRLGRMVTA